MHEPSKSFGPAPESGVQTARKGFLAWLPRWSLSTRIVAGLLLGVFVGLFLGEPAAAFQPFADIYVRLLQMTVLPYLVVALVVAFGQLDEGQAKRLAVRAGALLLITWFLVVVVILAFQLSLPSFSSASFFSAALVEPRQTFSIADLFFAANPFNALSNSIIPAVVLFSAVLGIGLIGLRDRDRVLSVLRVLNDAIIRITKFVIGLTPYGVFAIGAATAGTMSAETLERLAVYFIIFAAACLLLAFWVLPLVVSAVTPFRYGEVVSIAGHALLTAFVTNSAFIALPVLIERSKHLLEQHGLVNAKSESVPEILVPILFNFPNAGRLITLIFIPFSAWLAGMPLGAGDYPALFAVGIPSLFAKAQIALPYMMDLLGLPHDLFQLYIPTTIINGKFDSLLAAMNLLVFALLGAATAGGLAVFSGARIFRASVLIVAGIIVTVAGTRLLLSNVVDTSYRMDEALRHMHTPRRTRSAAVHRDLASAARGDSGSYANSLERVRFRGVLRMGYDPQNLPFSFFNADDELVGFDVELGENMSSALGLNAEFVPVVWPEMPKMLVDGEIDLMLSVWYRPNWFGVVAMSQPYLTGTMALAVRDERRHEFDSVERLRASEGLKVGIPLDVKQIQPSLDHYFGIANNEFIVQEFWNEYFEGKHPNLDAFLVPAENGAAWTLLHPEYTIVVPQPNPVKIPYAFGLAPDSDALTQIVNEWIVYAKDAGVVQSAYDQWILGQAALRKAPRWSIMRDVLGWVD